MEITADQVRSIRMGKQYLLDKADPDDLREVVQAVSINAQRLSTLMLSLRARIRGLEMSRVEDALGETRELVATWAMRGTLHLIDSRDIRWMIALLGPVFLAAVKGRRLALGLSDEIIERGCGEIRTCLHGTEPLTRWELMDALQRRGFTLERKSQAPIHLIRIAALNGLVCLGPYRDNGEPTYVLLGEWLPADSGASKPRLDRLLARYLEGYGPASLKDFAAWSGIPVTWARQAWDPGAFKEIKVGGSRLWADEIATPVAGNRVVRLLPAFDSYVLGYRDRDLVVASERRGDVYHGGQVAPTLIVDGAVAGVWRYERKGKKLLVEISSFKPLASPIKRVIKEEAEDVARFLGFSLSRESPLIRISRSG